LIVTFKLVKKVLRRKIPDKSAKVCLLIQLDTIGDLVIAIMRAVLNGQGVG